MAGMKNGEDSFLIKVAGEHRLDHLAPRLGYLFDTTRQPEKSIGPMLSDADRNELTVKLKYKLSDNLSLDAGHQLILFKDGTVSTGTNVFALHILKHDKPDWYQYWLSILGNLDDPRDAARGVFLRTPPGQISPTSRGFPRCHVLSYGKATVFTVAFCFDAQISH